ncbi:MAG: C40 family peptidase [Clostridia bacterium]|nr:C40 family peptidase [Clostridia bacterium]
MRKNIKIKIVSSLIFLIAVICNVQTVQATNTEVNTEEIIPEQVNDVKSIENDIELSNKKEDAGESEKDVIENGNITYPQDVTEEMADADYWKNKIDNPEEILLTSEEIEELNQAIINESGTNVYDITTIGDDVQNTQTEYTEIISNIEVPTRELYIDGELINNEEYFSNISNAIKQTGYNSEEKKVYYAVAVERADIKDIPTNDVIGYNATDPDDEMELTTLNVNEPFVVFGKCELNNEIFYCGYSNTYKGWVDGKKIAIVDDKDEWIESWKVERDEKDFIVVTNDKVILETSLTEPQTSEIKLTMGTVLKLVPDSEIPQNIGERGTYNNYVVYVPTRNEEGKYERKIALISEHEGVNVGFLPLTQENILEIAFNCLGDRYGWGGMLDAMDCSLYTKEIYQCFGIELPRDTDCQEEIPGLVHNISDMTVEEKQNYLEEAPVGSLLYFPGHTMIYIGTENGKSYVISALGSFVQDEDTIYSYSVVVNPLTVKRRNGKTWLESLTSILIPVTNEKHGTADNTKNKGNIKYAENVTSEMSSADYWKNLIENPDKVILTPEEIEKLNQSIIDGSGTMVFDLETLGDNLSRTQTEITNSLATEAIPKRNLYINKNQIDNNEYFTKLKNSIKETGYKSDEKKAYYAIAVKRADIKSWPTIDIIGYNATDPDDEMESSALNVNEPFIILGKCEIDAEIYYWGYSNNCTGWVYGKYLALIDDKNEWINAWKVNRDGNDFIVVTNDKVVLEKSIMEPSTSEVKLTIGTILKLVPDSEIPKNIGERGTYNNYVVYLPTRNEEGKYERKIALISEHEGVNVGFLPLTQGNILDVAFNCLGDRYGWGGMLDAMDCSLYTRLVYKCFGIELPRNTTWQERTPEKVNDVSKMTSEDKQKYLEEIHVGSLLYFPGHTMIYIGSKDGVSYVINAVGSFSETSGDVKVVKIYSIANNPLTVRRASGYTWLSQISAVLSLKNIEPKIYEYIEGANETFDISKDEKLEFEVNIEFTDFMLSGKVYIDGELVDITNYTARMGSTIITFNEDYTKKLSIGNHKIKVAVDDGEATTQFTIANINKNINGNEEEAEQVKNVEVSESNQDKKEYENNNTNNKCINNPRTDDNVRIWISLMMVSMLGLAGIGTFLKKNK